MWMEAAKAPISKESENLTLTPSSSKSIKPPPRPGFGRIGLKCEVKANHFLVQLDDRDFYHFDVWILFMLILIFYFIVFWFSARLFTFCNLQCPVIVNFREFRSLNIC